MRIIIKPLGALTIVVSLVLLTVLAFRPRNSTPSASSAPAATGDSPPALQVSAGSPAVIYDGGLKNGWENYGWAKVLDWKDSTHARHGRTSCIRAAPDGFQAVFFHRPAYTPIGYDRLTFFINGGDQGGQVVRVNAVFPDSKTDYGRTLEPLKKDQWVPVTLRLSDFGVRGKQKIVGFWVQNISSKPIPAFYLDGVRLLKPGEPEPTDG